MDITNFPDEILFGFAKYLNNHDLSHLILANTRFLIFMDVLNIYISKYNKRIERILKVLDIRRSLNKFNMILYLKLSINRLLRCPKLKAVYVRTINAADIAMTDEAFSMLYKDITDFKMYTEGNQYIIETLEYYHSFVFFDLYLSKCFGKYHIITVRNSDGISEHIYEHYKDFSREELISWLYNNSTIRESYAID